MIKPKLIEEPGISCVFTRQHVEGALPNGSRVVKKTWEEGDTRRIGDEGVILGSIGPFPHAGHEAVFGYFILWDADPKRAVFSQGLKIGAAEPRVNAYGTEFVRVVEKQVEKALAQVGVAKPGAELGLLGVAGELTRARGSHRAWLLTEAAKVIDEASLRAALEKRRAGPGEIARAVSRARAFAAGEVSDFEAALMRAMDLMHVQGADTIGIEDLISALEVADVDGADRALVAALDSMRAKGWIGALVCEGEA